jgi:ribose transport system permease protein
VIGRSGLPRGWVPDRDERAVSLLVGALIVVFSLTSATTFVTLPNAQNLARQTSFNGLIGLGEMVVMIGGGIDISVGAVMSMTATLVMSAQPHGVLLSIAIGLAFGAFVGLINGLLVTKLQIVPFIATLGTMTVVNGLNHAISRDLPIPGTDVGFTFLGAGSIGPVPVPLLFLLASGLGVHVLLVYTGIGRGMFAVGGNAEAAHLAGINVDRTRILSYVICGFLVSLAGVLLASELNTSSVLLGTATALFILTATIIGGASILGGRGSARGAVLGVLALTVLATGLNGLGVQTAEQTIVRALVFIVVVVIDALASQSVGSNRLRTLIRRTAGRSHVKPKSA